MKSKRTLSLDPRLWVGLFLVAGSVAGVYVIVGSVDDSQPIYSARTDLAPGDLVHTSDLSVTQVRMDGDPARYLGAGAVPLEGVVIARSINAGELIPASAVGGVVNLVDTTLVVPIEGDLSKVIRAGSLVDLWAVHELESGVFAPPVAITSGVIVVRLMASDSIVSGSITTGVEILVPKNRVARILAAAANGDVLSVLPANIP